MPTPQRRRAPAEPHRARQRPGLHGRRSGMGAAQREGRDRARARATAAGQAALPEHARERQARANATQPRPPQAAKCLVGRTLLKKGRFQREASQKAATIGAVNALLGHAQLAVYARAAPCPSFVAPVYRSRRPAACRNAPSRWRAELERLTQGLAASGADDGWR